VYWEQLTSCGNMPKTRYTGSKLLFAILWCASLCAEIFPKFFSRRTDQKQKCSLREVLRGPTQSHATTTTFLHSAHCLHKISSQPMSSLFCIDREMKYSPVLTNPILPLMSKGSPESSNRSSLRGLIAIHAGKEIVPKTHCSHINRHPPSTNLPCIRSL
jgi:hypothetical protein